MSQTRNRAAAAALTLLLSFTGTSCIHTTQFSSTPDGARVHMNGVYKGEAPAFIETRSGFPTTYYVKIEKPGYDTIETAISSAYRADLSLLLLIPGIIPYFFSARLENAYSFPLVEETAE